MRQLVGGREALDSRKGDLRGRSFRIHHLLERLRLSQKLLRQVHGLVDDAVGRGHLDLAARLKVSNLQSKRYDAFLHDQIA